MRISTNCNCLEISIFWKKLALFLLKDILLAGTYRYVRKVDCSSFVMCRLLALALPSLNLWRPLRVLTRQIRQAVCAINQSISFI